MSALDSVKSLIATSEQLDQQGQFKLETIISTVKEALDQKNQTVLDLFFNSSLKNYFFVHDKKLMVGNPATIAYSLYNRNIDLVPSSISKIDRISCWLLHCIPPNNNEIKEN